MNSAAIQQRTQARVNAGFFVDTISAKYRFEGKEKLLVFGSRPIKDISAPELLAVLRRIESRNAWETAHRTKQFCGQAFRYAVATGRAERNAVRAAYNYAEFSCLIP